MITLDDREASLIRGKIITLNSLANVFAGYAQEANNESTEDFLNTTINIIRNCAVLINATLHSAEERTNEQAVGANRIQGRSEGIVRTGYAPDIWPDTRTNTYEEYKRYVKAANERAGKKYYE